MATLHLPDVSEFQPNVDWKKVAAHNGGAAIIRVHNGYRVDHSWYGGARRAQAHKDGIRVLGLYQYFVPSRDPISQAKDFVALVGKLQPGEFVVLDVEDPGFHGDIHHKVEAWLAYVDQHLKYPGYQGAWVYSYASFIHDHGLEAIFKSNRHTWLAAYQSHEPPVPAHSLWQHADSENWPGIGHCDCSIFHGDVAGLEAKVFKADTHAPAPADTPKPVDHSTAKKPVAPRPKPAAPKPAETKVAPAVTESKPSAIATKLAPAYTHILHAVVLGMTSFLGSEAVASGHFDQKALMAAAVAAVRLALAVK